MIYYSEETERKISFNLTPDSIESKANDKQGQYQKPISIQFIFKFFHSLFYLQEYFIPILKFTHITRPHSHHHHHHVKPIKFENKVESNRFVVHFAWELKTKQPWPKNTIFFIFFFSFNFPFASLSLSLISSSVDFVYRVILLTNAHATLFISLFSNW